LHGDWVRVGSNGFGFRALIGWEQLPPQRTFVEVAGVATDSQDRVYVFSRGADPVMVFAPDGKFLTSWGAGLFVRPHGITIGPDDGVYCTDDLDHTVRKFTTDGRLLMTLGTSGQGSETGIQGNDYRTIRRGAPPFHWPTNLAIGPDGMLYVTDGYGNARVHKFTPDGRLVLSWGEPGSGPGQFNLPHGIAVDSQGRVYVADRENSRVQIFSGEGRFISEWTDVARPMQVCIDRDDNVLVSEVGWHAGLYPWQQPPAADAPAARVSIFDSSGVVRARWGEKANPCAAGNFYAPHDLCLDTRGDLYVGEVVMSAGGKQGKVPADCHALQKFVRER
jgi:DNA-binding beta-propeller fold protein YncE